MLRFTLRQLEYAALSAELGSIARAAEKLGVAQPSVSAALKKLEDQLGFELFIRRHAQGIVPTSQGQAFLSEARSLLQHAQDLQRSAMSVDGPLGGTLNLGSFQTIAPVHAPRLIRGFQQLYPQSRIHLHEGAQDDLLTGLRDGHYDLALLYRIDLPADIRAIDVATFEPYVLLPAEHRLAAKSAIHLQELAGDPLILLGVQPSRTYFLDVFRRAGVSPNVIFESPSIELVRGMVGQGLGISLLVTRPAGDQSYDGQKLCVRPIADKVQPGVIAIASLLNIRLTRLASSFESYCINNFSS